MDEVEDNDPKPDQDFELLEGERDCVEYPVRVARFSSVSTVTLYLVSRSIIVAVSFSSRHSIACSFTNDSLYFFLQSSARPANQRLFYLGFKGESRTYKKAAGDDISVGAHNTAPSTVPGLKEKYGSANAIIR